MAGEEEEAGSIHLDKVTLEEQQVAEEGETYGSGEVLVITGQAGHTLEVQPPPPPLPNIFDRLLSKLPLTQIF